MWSVSRFYEDEQGFDRCEVLFENEDYLECKWFYDDLPDKTGVEICEE